MKPALARSIASQAAAVASQAQDLTPFRWLLTLGFPPEVAAHIIAPDVFSADCV